MGNVFDAMKKHETEAAARQDRPSAAAAPQGEPRQERAAPARPPSRADIRAWESAEVPANGYSELIVSHHDHGADVTEEYRGLRTSLLGSTKEDRLRLVVTSAEAGEGKTVTALNLAVVLAERIDQRTIVVDCDLRRPNISKLLNASNDRGLVDVLHENAALEEVIQPTVYPNLFLLPAGKMSGARVGELIARTTMSETLNRLGQEYDHVLVDTPPLNRFADACQAGRATGSALLVVRMYKTKREPVEKAIRLLRAGNVEISGLVLTHRRKYIPKYLYRYS